MKTTKSPMATPFTIWADPHGFNSRSELWADIKDEDHRIEKTVTKGRCPTDLGPLYLGLRRSARILLLKYNAQGNASSLRSNARKLIAVLERFLLNAPDAPRGTKQDLRTLQNFCCVHETLRLVRLAQDGKYGRGRGGSYRHYA